MMELLGSFLADPDFALKAILALGGFIAFAVGLDQYRRAQLWKRKEFIGGELRHRDGDHPRSLAKPAPGTGQPDVHRMGARRRQPR